MIASVIPIGNSKGVRIPKNILSLLNIEDKVELEVHDNAIVIKKPLKKIREGWEEAFAAMSRQGDDELLIPDSIDIDAGFSWEWD
jgi:antitoxin MazE